MACHWRECVNQRERFSAINQGTTVGNGVRQGGYEDEEYINIILNCLLHWFYYCNELE